jgi:hypothetical protein
MSLLETNLCEVGSKKEKEKKGGSIAKCQMPIGGFGARQGLQIAKSFKK